MGGYGHRETFSLKNPNEPGMVVDTFNPGTLGAEAGESLYLRQPGFLKEFQNSQVLYKERKSKKHFSNYLPMPLVSKIKNKSKSNYHLISVEDNSSNNM